MTTEEQLLEREYRMICETQALRDHIATNAEHLVTRDILPDIDLLSNEITVGKQQIIHHKYKEGIIKKDNLKFKGPVPTKKIASIDRYYINSYRPALAQWRNPDRGSYPKEGGVYTIYRTNRSCNNDKKIYLLTGVTNLNRYPPDAHQMTVHKGDVKVINKFDMSKLAVQHSIKFSKPIIFKRGDDMRVDFTVPPNDGKRSDKIQLDGTVTEPVGCNVTD